jgi:nicotinamidase-related amidase
MTAANILLEPEQCVMLFVDFQAGLGFGVESMPRQALIHNAVALARTAVGLQSSRHRVHVRNSRVQWSSTSGPAGGSSLRKSHRAQKHERLGR